MLFSSSKRRPKSGLTQRILVAALAAASIVVLRPAITAAEEGGVAIELNKLEAKNSDCRAYFVIDNKSDKTYETLKLDFILFRPDGIIDQRFAVELAPLKAKKRTVKLFDVANTSCDEVGSFLINDVMDCKAGGADVSDCLEDLAVSSRTDNELNK